MGTLLWGCAHDDLGHVSRATSGFLLCFLLRLLTLLDPETPDSSPP